MGGTIVCCVSDTAEGRGALELGIGLSERLQLRLVLAHVADGVSSSADAPAGGRSEVARERAAALLDRLADEYSVADSVETREGVGDEAALLARIAAEEAADVILVGARSRGRLRRGLDTSLADQLESETSVPVVIAPRRAGSTARASASTRARR
jgi:nucleotide-binding universal stress UspA family protein